MPALAAQQEASGADAAAGGLSQLSQTALLLCCPQAVNAQMLADHLATCPVWVQPVWLRPELQHAGLRTPVRDARVSGRDVDRSKHAEAAGQMTTAEA